jgi:hypothetical protein
MWIFRGDMHQQQTFNVFYAPERRNKMQGLIGIEWFHVVIPLHEMFSSTWAQQYQNRP